MAGTGSGRTYSIKEVAALVGLPPSTLRYYEDVSVIPAIARDASRSSPVEWCNRFVSFGVGYALSWSGGSSCWVGCGVSRDLVRMSRLR